MKAHADGFDVFASPNLAPLRKPGSTFVGWGYSAHPHGKGEVIVDPITPQPIGVVTIYPGSPLM
ncbi:hypothetical protein ACNKHK_09235 [Shigella flexneri]